MRSRGAAVGALIAVLVATAHSIVQLYEPYSDDPDNSGTMVIKPETLNEMIPKYLEDGWQVVRIPPPPGCFRHF